MFGVKFRHNINTWQVLQLGFECKVLHKDGLKSPNMLIRVQSKLTNYKLTFLFETNEEAHWIN